MPGILETLLAFDHQFQRDQQQSPAFLHRRDRRYALDHGHKPGQKPDINGWLEQLRSLAPGQVGVSQTDPQLVFWQRVSRGSVAAGTVLGFLAMGGLLFYEGGQQINITVILGFVLLQLVLALYTAAQGLAGWQPWAPVLQRFLRRRPELARSGALTPVQPALMARCAQAAGLAFGISGLLALLGSVVLQDLAFGWSTTLNTSAEGWYALVSAVASPWAGWLPVATPSLELVSDTRFFRLENGSPSANAIRWGAWWPFVAATWTTYVIVPRFLLLGLATVDLRRKAHRALHHHPGYSALLWRMESPEVETGSHTADSGQLPGTHSQGTVPVPETPLVASWAGAWSDHQIGGAGESASVVRAGGRRSLAEDRTALEHLIRQRKPEDHTLLVLTCSWEPPTAELEDFLSEARRQLPGLDITLLPIAPEPAMAPPSGHLAQWLRFAERCPVPGIQVARPEPQEATP